MRYQRIAICDSRPFGSFKTEDTTAYSFRRDKKFHFVQKICLNILRRLGAYKPNKTPAYKTFLIDNENIIRMLYDGQKVIYKHDAQPTRLYIGTREFNSLMGTFVADNMFTFQSEYIQNRTIMGFKVYVIPWMEGALLLPDDRNIG